MSNTMRLMFIAALVSVAFSFGITKVSAAPDATVSPYNGYVEFQTNASINFEEIVKVVLTETTSGHYYTKYLYRINDYAGNLSVPFGTYSIQAAVVSDSGEVLPYCLVSCSPSEIVVDNERVAVPVVLKVEEFASGDVSPGTSVLPDDEEPTLGDDEEDDNPTEGAKDESTAPFGPDSSNSNEVHASETSGKSSVWVSLLISVLIFCVIALILWLVWNRSDRS